MLINTNYTSTQDSPPKKTPGSWRSGSQASGP
jgi:hypothetical protein